VRCGSRCDCAPIIWPPAGHAFIVSRAPLRGTSEAPGSAAQAAPVASPVTHLGAALWAIFVTQRDRGIADQVALTRQLTASSAPVARAHAGEPGSRLVLLERLARTRNGIRGGATSASWPCGSSLGIRSSSTAAPDTPAAPLAQLPEPQRPCIALMEPRRIHRQRDCPGARLPRGTVLARVHRGRVRLARILTGARRTMHASDKWLAAYLAGELDPDTARAVDEHLLGWVSPAR
jgi:hypothetical protein